MTKLIVVFYNFAKESENKLCQHNQPQGPYLKKNVTAEIRVNGNWSDLIVCAFSTIERKEMMEMNT